MKKRSMRIVVSNQEEIITGRIAQLCGRNPGRPSASWTKVDCRGGTVVTGELLTLRLKALEDSWTTLEGTGGPWRPLKALRDFWNDLEGPGSAKTLLTRGTEWPFKKGDIVTLGGGGSTPVPFLASQDALEVMRVTESLTESLSGR